ncbi:hypothetical protein MKW94_025191 [Papaver nudicaule]|uniref:TF-B3 domain-containing protein n=1 Tax=Papaver nudicaule TaxID=74823 RepID=A0AA41S742_PAPNU|nr:hypothetical protein [Papaver nudicaule]
MGTQQMQGRPSFFKVLIGNFTKELRIPFNFIENFNGMIPVDAILRSPSGRCWTVNVVEEENGLFFREGWPDFVRKHGLECDDFMTVKYLGNSQFKVKLYATNGCEKELPLPHKKRSASLSPSKWPYKKNKSEEGTWKKKERPYGEGTSTLPTASLIRSNLSCRIDGKERTAQVASSFKSKYPFFAVFIGESYLSQGYLVRSLASFIFTIFLHNIVCDVFVLW